MDIPQERRLLTEIPGPRSRELLLAQLDLDRTLPDFALGYRWDIVLRSTPFE